MTTGAADSSNCGGEQPEREQEQPLPWWRLALVTVILLGCQFCWQIQIGLSTYAFRTLGMPRGVVALAWLAGPISGMVVQPIVGAWSDTLLTRWGRRKPFLVGGMLLITSSLFLFAYSDVIGKFFGDSTEDCEEGKCPIGLGMSVISFVILDFSINAVQCPGRTLFVDVVPLEQQRYANAYFSFMTGCGNVLAALLGAIVPAEDPWFFANKIQAVYVMAIVVVLASMGTTIVFVREDEAIREYRNTKRARGARRASSTSSNGAFNIRLRESMEGVAYQSASLISIDDVEEGLEGEIDDEQRGQERGPRSGGDDDSDMAIIGVSGERRGVESLTEPLLIGRRGEALEEESKEVVEGTSNSWGQTVQQNGGVEDECEQNIRGTSKRASSRGGKHRGSKGQKRAGLLGKVCAILSKEFLIETVPKPVMHAFFVQCCTWYAFFSLFIFGSDWVASDLFRGNPNSVLEAAVDRYERGISLANGAYVGQALFAMLTSFGMKYLIGCVGYYRLYILSQAVEAVVFAAMYALSYVNPFNPSPSETDANIGPPWWVQFSSVVLIASLGFTWTCTMTIPWTITNLSIEHLQDKGLIMAFMNLSQCFPEILSSAVSLVIFSILPRQYRATPLVMLISGVVAALGGLLIVLLKVGQDFCKNDAFSRKREEHRVSLGRRYSELSESSDRTVA
eukprot:Nk52_evm29s232 gene=Nk52_evmTU29s232